MTKLLVAAFDKEGIVYVGSGQQLGMDVRILDCFEPFHKQLISWYGKDTVLHVNGRRADVTTAVQQEHFDAAIVHEISDFVRTALVVQALSEAGIKRIVVVTQDGSRRGMYRRCGAHRIVVAPTPEQARTLLSRYLPVFASA